VTINDRDDDQYWDALAHRVAARAARGAHRTSLDWLARSRTAWLMTSVLLAAVLMFVMLPARRSTGDVGPRWIEVVAPADRIGKAIVVRDQPPAVGTLLVDQASRSSR